MQLKKFTTEKVRLFQRETPLSRHIPIAHFNTQSIFETKDGAQGAVIQLDGCAYVLKEANELKQYNKIIANLLLSLDEDYAVHMTTIRRKNQEFPHGNFAIGSFPDNFEEAYSRKLSQKNLFSNDIYLTLLLKGPDKRLGQGLNLLQKLSHQAFQERLNIFREKQKETLDKTLKNVLAQLQSFKPRLLVNENHYSEVLGFFSNVINGESTHCRQPLQDIASYLPRKRICFGHQTIQWLGNTPHEHQFAAILSIKKYCPETDSSCLDTLLTLDVENIQTHSFLRIPAVEAQQLIRKQYRHLNAVDDASITQQEELAVASDLLASDRLGFGYHHNTIMIFAKTKEALEEELTKVTKCYLSKDIVTVRESLNLESAFWSQIPGNFSKITRSSLISTHNFADLCPLHNEPKGYINQNHLGACVLLVETPNRTPLYLNFHERSNGKQDISKGHTTIIAPSNAGKTTLMNALNLGAQKYNGTSIFFDRDRGCEIYVRAMGGVYKRIHPNEPTFFNPLQLADTQVNRHFLVRWLQALIESDGRKLDSVLLKQIEQVVERSFTLPLDKRRLSIIASFFPNDFPLETLSSWIQGMEVGRHAYLFDHPIDALSLNHKMLGFDMTHLLDNEPQGVIFPVLLYLFHRLEALFTGDLVGIYLDEGWQYLENPYWKEKLKAYLPSLRKKNVYMVFATQSPRSVARSSLRDELISGSATHIFLPNPKAESEDYCDAFKLSKQEYEFIRNSPLITRQFLFKQGNESAIGCLDLSGLPRFTSVLAANQPSLRILDQIIEKVGDNPECWLPLFYQELSC